MQMDEVSKVNYIQSNAQEFVRNQAPCKQMYKKWNYWFIPFIYLYRLDQSINYPSLYFF